MAVHGFTVCLELVMVAVIVCSEVDRFRQAVRIKALLYEWDIEETERVLTTLSRTMSSCVGTYVHYLGGFH